MVATNQPRCWGTALEDEMERPLPHNIDAERAVLGGILLDKSALRVAVQHLSAGDFFLPANQHIFSAMQRLDHEGKPIEVIGLWETLSGDPEVQAAGGAAYLAALLDGLPRVSNMGHYAAMVRKSSLLRIFAHAGNAIKMAALERHADVDEIQSRVRELLSSPDVKSKPRLLAVSAEELLRMDIPPRETLLDPILAAQSLGMLYSKRGLGKTFLALGIAVAVSSAGRFLRWTAPRARPVLYVDGELPLATLRERLAAIIAGSEHPVPSSESAVALRLITPDLQDGPFPDLSCREGQALIEAHLGGGELVILDNLSALCRVGKENEGESWLPVQEWALRLRRQGISVLFVHHAGKSGAQRGTSRREDLLDVVMALHHPSDYAPSEGLRCELHFEKCRGFLGPEAKPFEARMETNSEGAAIWTTRDLEDVIATRAAELFKAGMSVRDIAEELHISKSRAHRLKPESGNKSRADRLNREVSGSAK